MSKRNATTAHAGGEPCPHAHPLLKLRGTNPAYAELHEMFLVEPQPDDLVAYLATAGAHAADPRHLVVLARLRVALGYPLDVQAYEELRAAFVRHAR